MTILAMFFFARTLLPDGMPTIGDPLPFSPDSVVRAVRNAAFSPTDLYDSHLDSFSDEFMIGQSSPVVNAIGYQIHPAIAFDGSNYLAIWVDEREIWSRPMWGSNYVTSVMGVRISPSGNIIDTVGIQIHRDIVNGPDNVALAYGNGVFLIAWSEYGPGGEYDVWAARLNSQGVLLDPNGILLSDADGFQDRPKVCFGDSVFLIAWADSRNDSAQIRAARVTPGGTVLDPDGFQITPQAYCEPPVCFDGTNWFVAWEDVRVGGSKSIFGARISESGVVLDPGGINISQTNSDCRFPEISFNGSHYLVVWQDDRTGDKDIWGTRVDHNGVVLDSSGIHVSSATGEQWRPSVDFDGTNWAVAWHDLRNGDADVFATRINASGTVLDPAGIVISVNTDYQGCAAVCFGSSGYMITWHDGRHGIFEIYGARMQTSGTVMDPLGILFSFSREHQAWPQVAYDGTNYLVVWQDYRGLSIGYDICGARVAPDGTVLDPDGILIAASTDGEYSPCIAFNGTNYLVAYERWVITSNYLDIYCTRVTPGGVVLDPQGTRVSRQGMDEYDPAVASDGTNWFVLWEFYGSGSDPTLYGARVAANGQLIDTTNITVCNASGWQWVPAIAFNGTNYFAVWSDNRDGTADIYGARISTTGIVLDTNGNMIAAGGDYQRYPAVAFDGTNHLVVWESQPIFGQSDIYASRIDISGNVIDNIQLTFDPYDQFSPTICFDGENYMIVWHRDYDYPTAVPSVIQGARVKPDGTILDTFPVSTIPNRTQVQASVCAGSGDQVLVTYNAYFTGQYMAMRIAGRIWTPPVPVAESGENVKAGNALAAVPNPFVDYTRLPGHELELVQVYDIQGRQITTEKSDRIGAGLPAGVYFIKLINQENKPIRIIKIK